MFHSAVPPPTFPVTATQFHINQTTGNTTVPGPVQQKSPLSIIQNPQVYLMKCTFASSADYMTKPSFSIQTRQKKFGGKVINDVPIQVRKLNPELMSEQKRESFLSFAVSAFAFHFCALARFTEPAYNFMGFSRFLRSFLAFIGKTKIWWCMLTQ